MPIAGLIAAYFQWREKRKMNFDQAIRVHVDWKMKLSAYLSKPNGTLSASTVSQDNQCELGKWIRGEGQKFAKTPEFAKLTADHTHFHKAAGEVIRKADAGQRVAEEVALGASSEYATASKAVVSSLMKMKAAA
jgi:hypothetical protein